MQKTEFYIDLSNGSPHMNKINFDNNRVELKHRIENLRMAYESGKRREPDIKICIVY